MDCSHVRSLLHPYVDRELDAADASQVEQHLAVCGACRQAFDAQASLSAAIRKDAAYHRAPQDLLDRVRANVSTSPSQSRAAKARGSWTLWNRWMQLGAAVAASVLVTTLVTLHLNAPSADDALAAQVINAHARSVLTSHQMDVASSDRHAVKPWLSSKLDFSPPVVDLTTTGFPLRGGRLDYVDNRLVSVLIYAHRQHVIDLYVWPAAQAPGMLGGTRTLSKKGFNIVHWNDADMTYWAISDLNAAELNTFAQNYASAK